MSSKQKTYAYTAEVAKKLIGEMKWIYACHETLESLEKSGWESRFKDTYAGNTVVLIRRSLLNSILLGISCIFDKKYGMEKLRNNLKTESILTEIVAEHRYGEDVRRDINEVLSAFEKVEKNKLFRSLVQHRSNYLAHYAVNPQKFDHLKWGDEKELVKLCDNLMIHLQKVFGQAINESQAVREPYRKCADELWLNISIPRT